MKRLWIAAGLLLMVFAAALVNAKVLHRMTCDLSGLLAQAETSAGAGDWEAAESAAVRARQHWDAHSLYLHIVLRHSDIDCVDTGFGETLAFLRRRESEEYFAASARLAAQIRLIDEAERLSLENVL